MRTTITKLRRIIRKTITESESKAWIVQRHLDELAAWITEASEEGMEESYDATVISYMGACEEEGDPVTQEFVEAHLDELLENHPSIEQQGDMVVDPAAMGYYNDFEEDEEGY